MAMTIVNSDNMNIADRYNLFLKLSRTLQTIAIGKIMTVLWV